MKRINSFPNLGQISLIFFFGLLLQACGNPTAPSEVAATTQISTTSTPTLPVQTATPSPLAPTATPVKYGADWQTRWLQKIPCAAPCWEGITPGQTTAKEVLDILTKNNNIAHVQINWSGNPNEVGWEWIGGFRAGEDYHDGGGRALFEGSDARPIFLIGPNLEKPIFFGDIIKVYGEPSHILAGFNRNVHGGTTYFYYLAYLPLGFALYHSETHKFDISGEKFYFDSIFFFANNFEGFKKAFAGENDYKYFIPWNGFKLFDFYCQTREKNDFEPCSNL